MATIIKWNVTPQERDALIARHVMGWEPTLCTGEMWETGVYWKCSNCSLTGDWSHESTDTFYEHPTQCPCYTSNIADAWLVVEHFMAPDTSALTITHVPLAQHWQCEILRSYGWRFEAYGTTAMEAICICALHSKGSQVQR